MRLHEVIAARRAHVLERWKELVRGQLAPESTPQLELVDHIPRFIGEIVAALRRDAGLETLTPSPQDSPTAAGHGAQRLRLGFSLDSVVREYGALRHAIIAEGRDASAVTLGEVQVVFDCIIVGIAQAVSEYTHQRDAELQRQANEHFAFIAHELRNPLSTATMAFQHLEQTGELPKASRSVAALGRGLTRTSDLVNQTLQIARVASGVELHREWTTVGALFEDVLLGVADKAAERHVDLDPELTDDQKVHLDVRLVRSALDNVVRNAVKYTAPGSAVHVRARVANERLVLEVEDRCGGLEPGMVEAAFAPFVRLDTNQSGFGLGLAIAKQAVDAHGGTIRVQNIPTQGCMFVLELPLDGAAAG